MTDLRRRSCVMLLLAMALTSLVMMSGFKAPFFFDDNPNIVDNTAIHITALNADALKDSLSGSRSGPLGRPVSVLSFAITYYFFGLDAFAFKVINLCIHLLNGLLLFWLMTLLLCRFSEIPHKWLPIWITVAWLIHPINFLPVMLSVQRMTLLSALFMLLALISYLKSTTTHHQQKIGWWCASWLLFWPLSVLSKETGLLFPAYVFLIECLPKIHLTEYTQKHHHIKNKKNLLLLVLFLLLTATSITFYLGKNWLDITYSMRSFSLEQRLMTEARAVWFYVKQIILPAYNDFAIYHDDFLLSTNIVKPITTLIAIVGWALVTGFVFLRWYRYPVICFSISWFLIGHLIESTFVPLEIMHEHRNYFPSIGLIMLVGYGGLTIFQKLKLTGQPKLILIIALMPIILLSFFTWMRANQLGDLLVGAQMEASQHPQSTRANYSAAVTLIQAGYGDSNDVATGEKIKQLFERASENDPSFKLSHIGLIAWACASDRVVERSWVQELSRRLEFEPFSPGDIGVAKNLFDHLSSMPTCLSRVDIDRLFMAGGNNQKISTMQRVEFFEVAADYALIVFNDLPGTKAYLASAMAIAPHNVKLEEKFKIADKATSAQEIKIEMNKPSK